jgi:hypothetical protein
VIRIVAQTRGGGVLIMLGIVDTNIDRLRDGQPISVDLGKLLVQADETGHDNPTWMRGPLHLAIAYGRTHEGIVEDMRQGGIPVSSRHRKAARELDDQLRREDLL